MTKERAKELIPIMQAWIDGKKIQARHKEFSDVWKTYDYTENYLTIENEDLIWRIKPELREFWIVLYDNENNRTSFTDKYSAIKWLQNTRINFPEATMLHVKEVM